ncbi:MAG: hypothetical protein EVA89_16360 [Sandaracinaceae bacterium]|nr:MAG: hypothetical protein EVA89_16360 [Sandaracinaceae bacterium]
MSRLLWVALLLASACESPAAPGDASAPTDASAPVDGSTSADAGPAPLLAAMDDLTLDEREAATVVIPARAGARVFVEGAPPGTVFDEPSRTLALFPDFTQSGTYPITVDVLDERGEGAETASATFTLTVRDTITPPDPVIVGEEALWGATLYSLELTTDDFLDPPGLAGRTFEARVVVPDAATAEAPLPLSIGLHGSGGSVGTGGGSRERFGIGPSEPYVSWWTGQHSDLPDEPGADATVANNSQRRILHLLDWVTRTFEGVDRERVSVSGSSMGGSGAVFFAIRYGYHLSHLQSLLGMTSALVSGREDSFQSHWGARELELPDDRGMSVWERYDLSRALAETPWLRDVHFTTDSGVRDGLVTFHHVSTPSPLTDEAWADAAQRLHVGHRIVWDQRGHQTNEAGFRARWYGALPDASTLRRDRPFPAFTRSSLDQAPPRWDEAEGAFTGGDPRGMRNRYLAWVTADVVDERDRLELPLFVRTDPPAMTVADGYPEVGHGYTGALPVTVDVTPRRVRRFRCLPGETLRWRFGEQSGAVIADDEGAVTVPGLALGAEPVTLVLTRS